MQNTEKNILLEILRSNDLVNRMGFIGDSSILLGQSATWNTATDGKLTLATPIIYDFTGVIYGFTGVIYGLTIYTNAISLGVPSSFIALNFNSPLILNTNDTYSVNGIEITIKD